VGNAAPHEQNATAEAASRHFIIGTAGHIDHGKSSLVKALTGTDPDRLPEEKRRGMTIELGFAELAVGDTRFGVVDVPGHERFVRTMVAGATGIDLALLVVAADDSVMPQTIEHVDVLRLLGVKHAVVALTKIDVVDASMIELVTEEVRSLLAGTLFADCEIRPVSSVTRAGLDDLKEAIHRASRRIESATPPVPFRMAVDRVFSVQGRGTVVTGSVLRGRVSPGDSLEAFPGGVICRVRDVQTHGVAQPQLRRGQRAALNLGGVDREQLARGAELATPGYVEPSRIFDARIETLASLDRPLKSTQTVRMEIGTTELPVRVILVGSTSLAPGESGYAQLRGGEPIPAVYGQRFILRDENAAHTVGGGMVLRPAARRRRREQADAVAALETLESGETESRVEMVLRDAGFARLTDLQICARSGAELEEIPAILDALRRRAKWGPVAGTEVFATGSAVDDLSGRLVSWLERHHRLHPEQPGRPADAALGWIERVTGSRAVARPLLEELVAKKTVKRLGRFLCAPAFAPALSAADEKLLAAMVEEIRAGGFQPPALAELSIAKQADRKRIERLATLAVALGDLVPIDGVFFLHAEREAALRGKVAELIGEGGGVTVSEVREALGSSRKFVVPFLEYLDRIGFTRRMGDSRALNKVAPPNSTS
jgi:selenocysteine-specific elongation factor